VTDTPLLVSFYADDFTGATDVMDTFARNGLRTVLFSEVPTSSTLERFPDVAAVGVAGRSRATATEDLEKLLRPVLERLRKLGAPVSLYKVCSTFDSSAAIGSIGRALEIGLDVFEGQTAVPVAIAVPRLGRYLAFGNLFARAGSGSPPYRLDRHPTMRRHPVTPMTESDLLRHLGEQTALPLGLVDLSQLNTIEEAYGDEVHRGARAIFLDTVDDEHLRIVGRHLAFLARSNPPLLVVGSSAVAYALSSQQSSTDKTMAYANNHGGPAPSLVVSGSCSAVSAAQIRVAFEAGFVDVAVTDPSNTSESACEELAERAAQRLDAGLSVVVHTALGPDDARVRGGAALIGHLLAGLTRRILELSTTSRLVVIGGDTSGAVVEALWIQALEAVRESSPGAPLCRAYAADPRIDSLEIVLKGGQLGMPNTLVDIAAGRASRVI
jgi:3-oxoisoapionate kinase